MAIIPADRPSSNIVPFSYGGADVRTITLSGEPWFVLADLCSVLGLTRGAAQVAERLDDGVRQTYPITDALGRTQRATIVSESGMYEVVIRSDKPGAVTFRRWITSEVLPAIRKTGSYITPAATAALPDRKALARMVIESEEARERAEARIIELEPKAALADDFLVASGGQRLVRETAKLLGMREKDLRRFLLDEKLIFAKHAPCGTIMYDHYAQFADHFKMTEQIVAHTTGSCTHYTLRILPRGIELIRKRINDSQPVFTGREIA